MHTMRSPWIRPLLMILPFFVICSCASLRTKMMLANIKPMRESVKAAVNKSTDTGLVRDGMPASLLQMDGFIEMAPDNQELLVAAAESYSGYAFAFVEETDPKRAANLNLKARGYALRALADNEDFIQALDKPLDDFTPTLAAFEKEDVPALFYAANTWLKYISFNLDNPELLMDIPKVEAMMFRIEELDDQFMYGSIHAMLGAYYAARSKTLGGQPELAKAHFDKAFEISGNKYLVFHFLYARFYAVQLQDQALFEKTLQQIIDAPPGLMPEKNLVNEIAREKARKLIAQADEFF
ncbi:MAG: TRAP transporter TatT component family protein [Thermodesulfobacteriota bacterium]